MRKKLFILMLMLATVVAVQAQSLTGKMWAADMSEPGMPNVHLVLMFEDYMIVM